MSVDKIAKQKVKYNRYLNKKPMTICIASICESPQAPKIVFSADRMVTDYNGLTFEHGVPKIVALTSNYFIMSAGRSSEADQIIQNVNIILSSYDGETLEKLTIKGIVDLITKEHQTLRNKCIEDEFLVERGLNLTSFYDNIKNYPEWFGILLDSRIGNYDFGVEFIVFGFNINNNQYVSPHLYKITEKGQSLCFDSIGFVMIGIGETQSFPEITKEPYSPVNSLSEAIVRTYWAKKSAERMTGVGRFTDLGLAWIELNNDIKKLEVKSTLISQELITEVLETNFEEQRNKVKQMTIDIKDNIDKVFLGQRAIDKK